jgi:hypothetical protein
MTAVVWTLVTAHEATCNQIIKQLGQMGWGDSHPGSQIDLLAGRLFQQVYQSMPVHQRQIIGSGSPRGDAFQVHLKASEGTVKPAQHVHGIHRGANVRSRHGYCLEITLTRSFELRAMAERCRHGCSCDI